MERSRTEHCAARRTSRGALSTEHTLVLLHQHLLHQHLLHLRHPPSCTSSPPSSIALSCYPPSCTSCTCSTSGPPTIACCTCTSLALSTAQLHLQHGAALYSPAVRMRLPLRPAPDTPRPLRRFWAAAAYRDGGRAESCMRMLVLWRALVVLIFISVIRDKSTG